MVSNISINLKMNLQRRMIFWIIIIVNIFWSEWPIGVNKNYSLESEAYSYSSITNLKIVNGFVWSDNSCTYAVSNGLISASDYSMISKFDGQFNTVWKHTLAGKVQHQAVQLTLDQNYLVFAPYQTLTWTVVKLSTSDGSISLQSSPTLVTQWQSVQLSSDNTSIYLAGFSTGPVLIKLNLSDLTIVSTMTHSSLQIVSIYAYSSSMLLVNSINVLNTNYQISAVDTSTSSLTWASKFSWLIACSTPSSPVLSLIWTSTNQVFQLLIESGVPVFFAVNLSTGALSGSFYQKLEFKFSVYQCVNKILN